MKVPVTIRLGGVDFVAELEHVEGRGIASTEMRRFQRKLAQELIDNGPRAGDSFTFLRKMSDLQAATLAELLDTNAETISRWENEKNSFPYSAWITLTELAEEHLEGKSHLRTRLMNAAKRRASSDYPSQVRLDLDTKSVAKKPNAKTA